MAAAPGHHRPRTDREGSPGQPQFRYPAVLVLMVIAVVFLIGAPATGWARGLSVLIEGMALVIAVATSRERESVRRHRAIIVGLVLLVAVSVTALDIAPRWLVALIALAVTVGVPVVLSRGLLRLLRTAGVTLNAVAGALAIYMSTGLLFSWLVGFVALVSNGSYFTQHASSTQGDKVYFSFTVLTTTGFGDFTPATAVGHALAVIEMLVGQIYLVTVIGLLIGNYAGRAQHGEESGP